MLTGFVVSESADAVTVREANGLSHTLKLDDIEERAKREISMMPDGIAGNLTPEELADLLAYLGVAEIGSVKCSVFSVQ